VSVIEILVQHVEGDPHLWHVACGDLRGLAWCAWQLPVTALARSRLLQGLVPGLLQKVI
jgi:hypothetical protein